MRLRQWGGNWLAAMMILVAVSGFSQDAPLTPEADAPAPAQEDMPNSLVFVTNTILLVPGSVLHELGLNETGSRQVTIDQKLYRKLLDANGVRQVSCSALLVSNSDEGTVQQVQSRYYPESWRAGRSILGGPNNKDVKVTVDPFPEFSDPLDLGMKMTFTPTVLNDGPVSSYIATSLISVAQPTIANPILMQTKSTSNINREFNNSIYSGTPFIHSRQLAVDGNYFLHIIIPTVVARPELQYQESAPQTPEQEDPFTQPISTSLQVVEISAAELIKLNDGKALIGPPPPGFLNKLLDSGKARLVDSIEMVLQNSVQVVNQHTLGTTQPVNWMLDDPEISETNLIIHEPKPCFDDETSPVGSNLEITASWFTGYIQISVTYGVAEHTGWTIYPFRITTTTSGREEQKSYDLKMPEYANRSLNTLVKVKDGETICLGYTHLGFDPLKEDFLRTTEFKNDIITLYFLSANIVSPSAKSQSATEKTE